MKGFLASHSLARVCSVSRINYPLKFLPDMTKTSNNHAFPINGDTSDLSLQQAFLQSHSLFFSAREQQLNSIVHSELNIRMTRKIRDRLGRWQEFQPTPYVLTFLHRTNLRRPSACYLDFLATTTIFQCTDHSIMSSVVPCIGCSDFMISVKSNSELAICSSYLRST